MYGVQQHRSKKAWFDHFRGKKSFSPTQLGPQSEETLCWCAQVCKKLKLYVHGEMLLDKGLSMDWQNFLGGNDGYHLAYFSHQCTFEEQMKELLDLKRLYLLGILAGSRTNIKLPMCFHYHVYCPTLGKSWHSSYIAYTKHIDNEPGNLHRHEQYSPTCPYDEATGMCLGLVSYIRSGRKGLTQ